MSATETAALPSDSDVNDDNPSVRTSTRDRLAAYDARQSAKASGVNHPIPRMAQAGAPRRASTDADGDTARFFFIRDGRLTCAMTGETVKAATPQIIADTMSSPGKVVVPINSTVAGHVIRMMREGAASATTPEQTELFGKASRMLRFAHAAVVSSKFIVLTEALGRKFYAPTGTSERNLTAWAKLFEVSITQSDPASGMASLLTRVWSESVQGASDFGSSSGDNPWRTILMSEQAADEVSDRGGPGSMSTQFGAAQAIAEGWGALCRVDPLLRHRCAAVGEVVRIRVVATEGAKFIASVSGPVRLREGGCIVTSADHKTAGVSHVDLKGFVVDEDGALQLVLTRPVKRTQKAARDGVTALFNALHDGDDLYLSGAPFLNPAGRVSARHWSGTKVKPEDRVTRDVPLYVALAGG